MSNISNLSKEKLQGYMKKSVSSLARTIVNRIKNMSKSDEEKTQKYIQEAMSWLADSVENGEKKEGYDLAAYVEICGTENSCRIAYTHITGDSPDIFTLTLDVYYNGGSDRMYSQYDFMGTNEQFYEYVRKPVYDHKKFYERIMDLSNKLDDYLKCDYN